MVTSQVRVNRRDETSYLDAGAKNTMHSIYLYSIIVAHTKNEHNSRSNQIYTPEAAL